MNTIKDFQDSCSHLDILSGDGPESKVSDGEEEVEGEEGYSEGDGDAAENECHPLVPLSLALLSSSVYCNTTVPLKEGQDLKIFCLY